MDAAANHQHPPSAQPGRLKQPKHSNRIRARSTRTHRARRALRSPIDKQTHQSRPPSRRVFLGRIAASLAAPVAIGACSRESEPPSATETAPVKDPDPVAFRIQLPDREPLVRVRLRRVAAGDTARIGPPTGTITVTVHDPTDDAEVGRPIILHAPVAIVRRKDAWQVRDGCGWGPTVGDDAVLAFAEPGAPTIALDEIPHPGTLRCVAISDGRFDVVNHVLIESYLPGVLAGELYSHWKPTTFAAQAIAARSFACAERVIFARTRHYDLVNTAASQMYVGSAAERRPHDAVEATRGVVLSYADALVPGYYSSCCGGRAAAAPDAIGSHPLNTLPPLQGRDLPDVCGNAPLYRWKMERSKDDVVRRISAWGRSQKSEDAGAVKSLAGVDVEEVNPHGRPRRYRVRTTEGASVVFDAEDFRRAVDYSAGRMSGPARRLWSAYLEIDVGRTRVEFAGRGHGHGVGLCQYGAEELAQNGRTFEEILAWYYPSVRLTQAFGGSLAAR